jgi:hypothetical protein
MEIESTELLDFLDFFRRPAFSGVGTPDDGKSPKIQ